MARGGKYKKRTLQYINTDIKSGHKDGNPYTPYQITKCELAIMDIQDLTQLPKTRQEAIELGSKYYFTGKACKHGHFFRRRTKDKCCCECQSIKTKKSTDYLKVYRAANKDRIKFLFQRWQKENIEYVYKYQKEYKFNNLEIVRGYISKAMRKYRELHPERVREQKLKRRNVGGKFTRKDILDLLVIQKKKCVNCNVKLDKSYHVDHIMPIKLGGDNDKKNLQILCKTCNLKKNAKHPIDWAQENGRLL